MQYEKNTEQGQTELSENEITFAQSLDDALEKALGTGDNVTSIWSHLKDEQRARLAADYLAALNTDSRKSSNFENNSSASPTTPEAPPEAQQGTAAARTAPPQTGPETSAVPRGYPANFNPLAGFPGLEPSSNGPSPTDIIAGSLGNPGSLAGLAGLQGMSGMPGSRGSGNTGNQIDQMQRSLQDAMSLLGNLGFEQPAPCQPLGTPPTHAPHPRAWQSDPLDDSDLPGMEPAAPNFWPLWMDQQDSLLKQCLKLMSGNMDDAQDALSEAMLKASVKFEDSMDEIRNHRAWLSRIVHNACIDLHRQNRRKAEYKEENHGTADAALPPISGRNEPSPEESFLATEMFDHLERALRALPEKLRKPLLMRCVEDRSYDDIAVNLGLSNCAVRKRVQLARDHLRGAGIQ
ncbi:sigma-70 family RNA polymerase sigma factor [Thalassospira sp.]|uniref:RNA polymerase sigma factor n=1 Tax=Thalassospira sp. TaxID=1912094 RepID=UPI000C5FE844|nr:sigma-70 family RNA polymerase sigma factor [Thalassospira sp.]MAB35234.1 hypothetical protein [Thalassospira sp.]